MFFYGLTSKFASRQTGVHFFDISTSKSVPGLRCFDHAYFRSCFVPHWCAIFHLASAQMAPHAPLQRAYFSTLRNHKTVENTVFCDSSTFSRACIFFLLSFFLSSELLSSAFLFSDSSQPCFSICPNCRKFDF